MSLTKLIHSHIAAFFCIKFSLLIPALLMQVGTCIDASFLFLVICTSELLVVESALYGLYHSSLTMPTSNVQETNQLYLSSNWAWKILTCSFHWLVSFTELLN